MALGRLLRAFMAPAPDPRRTYRDAASLGPVERRLRERLDVLAARERTLAERRSAAEAQVRVGEALAGISDEIAALGPDLARAEEEAEALEARAAAIARLLDADGEA